MGLGLSQYVPLVLYILGFLVALLTIVYKVEIGIFFFIPLIPLHTVLVKMHQYPMGKDFIDILFFAMLIGWAMRGRGFEKSSTSWIIFLFVIITYLGLWRGSSYLGQGAPITFHNPRFQDWKNYMLMPLLYFIILNNVQDRKHMKWLIILMSLSMLFMDQRFYHEFSPRSHSYFRYDVRSSGTFGYLGANHFGAFFVQYSAILLGLFFLDKDKRTRLLFPAVIAFNTYSIIFSYSRGAYAALLAVIGFFGVTRKRSLLALMTVLLISWQVVLPSSVVERINMTQTEEGELESSAGHRLVLWQHGIGLFEENPVFGVGYRVYQFTMPEGERLRDPHNMYMSFLAELGLIGLSLFLFLFYLAFRSGWRLYRSASDGFLKGLGLGFAACVIGCMVANAFGDRWSFLMLGGFYWVFWGMVDRGQAIVAQERKKIDQGWEDME